MATATAPARGDRRKAPGGPDPATERAVARRRRRQMPLVVVGALLVVGCALAFADASLRVGGGGDVLVVAQPVAAGEVLTAGDLRGVRLSLPGGVATVPASEEQVVVGQPAAVPLAAGTVLTRADVGAGALVGASSDVVAVALKPGAYPPALAPGDRVEVVPVPASSGAGSGPSAAAIPLSAVVLALQAPSATSGSPAVVSLVVARADAAEVASLAAAGEVAIVQVGTAG